MVNIKNGENAYHILLALTEEEKRFSQLLKEVKKASLAKELNELLELRYVSRRLVDSKPPRTFYNITAKGREFLKIQIDPHISKLEIELQRLKSVRPDKVRELKGKI